MAELKPRTPPQLRDPVEQLQAAVDNAAKAQQHAKEAAKKLYQTPPAEPAKKGA